MEVTTNHTIGYTFAIDTFVFDMEGSIGTGVCTSTPNSSGSAAFLSAAGSVSVAANSLAFEATPLPANTFGLVYYGPNSVQIPFGDGFRCVGGSLSRLAVSNSGPNGVLSTGVDLTMPPTAGGQVMAGSTWFYQAWFRDLSAGGAGFNLSDSLRVQFTN